MKFYSSWRVHQSFPLRFRWTVLLAMSRVGSIDRSSVQGIKICFVCVLVFISFWGAMFHTICHAESRHSEKWWHILQFCLWISNPTNKTANKHKSLVVFHFSFVRVYVYFSPSFSSPITTQTLVCVFDDKEYIIITTATVCTLCVLCVPVFVTERQPGKLNTTKVRPLQKDDELSPSKIVHYEGSNVLPVNVCMFCHTISVSQLRSTFLGAFSFWLKRCWPSRGEK